MSTPSKRLAYALAELNDALKEQGVNGTVRVVLGDEDYHRFRHDVAPFFPEVSRQMHPLQAVQPPQENANEALFCLFGVQIEPASNERARVNTEVRNVVERFVRNDVVKSRVVTK